VQVLAALRYDLPCEAHLKPQGGKKRLLMSHLCIFEPFIYRNILLPRQARDKHRESTRKKEGVFLCFAGERDRCRALLNVRAASGRAWRRM